MVVARAVAGSEPPGTATFRFVPVPTTAFRVRVEERLASPEAVWLPEVVVVRADAPPGTAGDDDRPIPAPAEIARRLRPDAAASQILLLGPTRDPSRWTLCVEDGCVLAATPETRAAVTRELADQGTSARTPPAPDAAATATAARLASADLAPRAAQELLEAGVPALVSLLGDRRRVSFNRILVTAPDGTAREHAVGSVHGPGTVGQTARALLEAVTAERCPCTEREEPAACDPDRPACAAFWAIVAAKSARQRNGAAPSACAP